MTRVQWVCSRAENSATGRFNEAGLHDWMPFVIFHTRCRESSQRHFRADFWVGVASYCVQQWKLNQELQSSTNATTVAVAKITGEGGWRVEKKCLCVIFCSPKDCEFMEKVHFGASYSTSNKLLLVARHILTTGLQKCLYSWQCKIHKFTVTAFHCEESMHQK